MSNRTSRTRHFPADEDDYLLSPRLLPDEDGEDLNPISENANRVLAWAETEFLKWHPAARTRGGPSRRVKSLLYSLRRLQIIAFIIALIMISILGVIPVIVLSAVSLVFVVTQLLVPQALVLLASLLWPVPLSPLARKRAPVVLELFLIPTWLTILIIMIVVLANWSTRRNGWLLCLLSLPVVVIAGLLTLFTAYVRVRVHLTEIPTGQESEDIGLSNVRKDRYSDTPSSEQDRHGTKSKRRSSF